MFFENKQTQEIRHLGTQELRHLGTYYNHKMNNKQHNANNSEVEFELIGLYSFFNDENDKNINWAEFFQITNYCQ
ncbi:MAG: hypothetical protein K9G70_07545 [Prolixibacteraceae bacterium]|nr:hypothetical protein [Prolixibacteraceae bacterium]